MDDLIGEGLFYIFGPIIGIFALIGLCVYGVQSGYELITGKPKVEEVQQPVEPVQKETLAHKAGHKTKEVGKDFIKGFFSN